MSKGFEGTKGVWESDAWCDEHGTHHYAVTAEDGEVAVALCGVVGASDAEASIANRQLIAEAGTVLHETGLTPRQLAEQRANFLEALRLLYDELERDHYGESYEPDPDEAMGIAKTAIANATQQRNATGGEG